MRLNKIVVGYNHRAEQQFNESLKRKQTAFKDYIDYVSAFLIVSPTEAYNNGLETTFLNEFKAQKLHEFPAGVVIEKAIELLGIELHRIQAYDKVFKSIPIEFNATTGEAERPDWNLYLTEKEQIERYNRSLKLCNEVNSFNADFGNVLFAQIIHGLGSRITYDWNTNQAVPNIAWVRNEIR